MDVQPTLRHTEMMGIAQVAVLVVQSSAVAKLVALASVVFAWKRGFARHVPTVRSGFAIDPTHWTSVTVGSATAAWRTPLVYAFFMHSWH